MPWSKYIPYGMGYVIFASRVQDAKGVPYYYDSVLVKMSPKNDPFLTIFGSNLQKDWVSREFSSSSKINVFWARRNTARTAHAENCRLANLQNLSHNWLWFWSAGVKDRLLPKRVPFFWPKWQKWPFLGQDRVQTHTFWPPFSRSRILKISHTSPCLNAENGKNGHRRPFLTYFL